MSKKTVTETREYDATGNLVKVTTVTQDDEVPRVFPKNPPWRYPSIGDTWPGYPAYTITC